jgi:hypothetical protein
MNTFMVKIPIKIYANYNIIFNTDENNKSDVLDVFNNQASEGWFKYVDEIENKIAKIFEDFSVHMNIPHEATQIFDEVESEKI